MQKINASCPSCGHAAKASDDHVGKKITCPKCRHSFQLVGEVIQPPSSPKRVLPPDWRDVLRICDFELAKKEILKVLSIGDREAADREGRYYYREEFVHGLEVFAQRPCYETAVAFIEGAPDYCTLHWSFFVECCPGGLFAMR